MIHQLRSNLTPAQEQELVIRYWASGGSEPLPELAPSVRSTIVREQLLTVLVEALRGQGVEWERANCLMGHRRKP